MEIYLLPVAAILVWVLFSVGVIHVMRFYELQREKKNATGCTLGLEGSPTSNSRKVFRAKIEKAEKKGRTIWLSGTITGCAPRRNDVVYLEYGERRIPVILCRVISQDMPEDGMDALVRMKIACMPQTESRRLSELNISSVPVFVTNLRQQETLSPQDNPILNDTPDKLLGGFQYPIIVKVPIRELAMPAVMLVMCVVVLIALITGIVSHTADFDRLMFGCFLAAGGLCLSAAVLICQLGFCVKITKNHVEIRNPCKTRVYHFNNLRYTTTLATDKSEVWYMRIFDKNGKELAAIKSSYPHYETALMNFRAHTAAAKKAEAEEKSKTEFRNYLLHTMFYIPAITLDADPDDVTYEPLVKLHKETRKRAIFMFSDENIVKREYPDSPIIQTMLENAVPMITEYKLEHLLIWEWLESEQQYTMIEITEDRWNELSGGQT